MLPRLCFWLETAPLGSLVCLVVFLFSSAQISSAQTTTAGLSPGSQLTLEIKGGEKQYFELPMDESSAATVVVRQMGIDVAVRLLAPEGKTLVEADLDVRRNGLEKLDLVSVARQIWKIEVEARNKLDPPGSYEVAVSRFERATDKDKELFNAWAIATEGQTLRTAGKFRDALAAFERALAAFEAVLAPEAFEVGLVTNRIGIMHHSMGDATKSAEYLERALTIYEKSLPPDSLHIAEVQNNLSIVRRLKGDFAEAESLLLRSLAIKEKVLGRDSRSYTVSLLNLGIVYRNRGDNDKAEQTYEQVLEIRERVLGKEHADIANVLNNIAAAKYYRGDYAAAVEYQTRAIEVAKKNFGPDNAITATMVADLAGDYADWGRTDQAERLYLEAIGALRKNGERSDVDLAFAATGLGRFYRDRGELEMARPLLLEALTISEKYGEGRPIDLARSLLNHGKLLIRTGELADAEHLFRRSLDLSEKHLGPDHPSVAEILDSLALVAMLRGNVSSALEIQSRANRLSERNIVFNLSVGTQHQRLSYLQLSAAEFNQTIALDAEKNGGPKARELAVAAVLQRKGRVLDALAGTADILRRKAGPEDAALIQRLKDTDARLASLALNKPGDVKLDEYRKGLEDIQKEKDRLEVELSRRTAGFFEPSRVATPEEIRRLIPLDAALVEIVKYSPPNWTPVRAGGERYVAYIIKRTGQPAMVPLGAATDFESLLARYRSALRDPQRSDVNALGRSAFAKLMRHMLPHLAGVHHLIISPDGELNLVPFESLLDDRNKFVVEHFAISYVTSGRDLVRMGQKRESRGAPTIFANPDYGTPAASDVLRSPAKNSLAASAAGRSITVTRELASTYFAPLRGTAAEAVAIRQLFPNAEVRTGPDATETAFKSVTAPLILHVATHGFFLTDDPGEQWPQDGRNPLLRSGVALADANARSGGPQDGLLTALEASGLDLWGTRLVVLSACDTGVGEVRAGEGVFGLRRALVLAGAETLVMSLWPVSDYVTRELMTGYYRNLKQGLGRGESLRQAQLAMLRRPGRRHPFYWSSFIRVGEWADLNGNR